MKKTLAVAGLMVSLMLPTLAQAQGGPGGGGFGGGQRSMKGRLTGLMRGLGDLEHGTKAPLNKAQARQVLGFVRPWLNKPVMTDDQAKGLYMHINTVLSTRQKNELDIAAAANRKRMEGSGGMGGGRQGGGANGQTDPQAFRAQMQKMQGFFKTYNPLYPPTSYGTFKQLPDRMQERFTKSYASRQQLLAKLAAVAR